MSGYRLPRSARAWLKEVDLALAGVDGQQRAEIVDGLRAHIIEALDQGDSVDLILGRLGSPAEIGQQASAEEGGTPKPRS